MSEYEAGSIGSSSSSLFLLPEIITIMITGTLPIASKVQIKA
jgi:hypothetical protein